MCDEPQMSERLVEFLSDRGPQFYRGALILVTASEDLIIISVAIIVS